MTGKLSGMKQFFRDLNEDESATGTVEWMMLIVVALIVLAVIYMFVSWAIEGTAEAAKSVEGEYGDD